MRDEAMALFGENYPALDFLVRLEAAAREDGLDGLAARVEALPRYDLGDSEAIERLDDGALIDRAAVLALLREERVEKVALP